MSFDKEISNHYLQGYEEISDDVFKKSFELTKNIDPKDKIYVALAISCDALFWVSDLKLQRSLNRNGFNGIITTLDFKQILKAL